MRRFTLTAIGRDRPGIVAAVTKALYEHDCNIEDSTMTALEDEFAIILIMSMSEGADAEGLASELKGLEATGLSIHMKEVGERQKENPPGNYLITLHGADKAGIVYRTARMIADLGINITDLETRMIGSPPVYIMLIEIFVPEAYDAGRLGSELSGLEKELGVTIRLKPVEEPRFL